MGTEKIIPSEGKELELKAFQVNAPASEAMRDVLQALEASNIKKVAYAIRSRTKTVQKIIEKVHLKRNPEDDEKEPKPYYEPENIRDIVGLRIITLFREDMIEVLRDVLKMIEHNGDATSPFINGEVEEAIIYSPDVVGDTQAISNRVRAVLRSSGFENITHSEVMESMYSSIHLVVWCEPFHEGKRVRVPVEIQIRTVFEDAWGEIDHKLRYKDHQPKAERKNLPHLNVLKSFTDGCSKYADLIKLSTDSHDVLHVPRSIVRSLGVGDVIKAIGSIATEVKTQIEEAYKLQSAGMASIDSDKTVKLLNAAELFQKICDDHPPKKAQQKKLFRYYMMMEKAFCLLESGDRGALNQAVSIYLDMESEYPNHPIVQFRLGSALADLNDEEEAVKALLRAKELLDDNVKDNWVPFSIYRRLGFLYWQISTKHDIEPEEKKSALLEAYKETKESLKYVGGETDRLGCLNNLIYFALDYYECLGPISESEINRQEFEDYFKEFTDLINVNEANIYQLDTLARAYCFRGQKKEASDIARIIEIILRKKSGMPEGEPSSNLSFDQIAETLSDSEKLILSRANWIVRHGTCESNS